MENGKPRPIWSIAVAIGRGVTFGGLFLVDMFSLEVEIARFHIDVRLATVLCRVQNNCQFVTNIPFSWRHVFLLVV